MRITRSLYRMHPIVDALGVDMTTEQRKAIKLRVERNRRKGLHEQSKDNLANSIKESIKWRESIELKAAKA